MVLPVGTRWRRYERRAVQTTIAAILLVAMTISAGVILWTFRPKLPSPTPSFTFQAIGNVPEPVWGDGSDCTGGSNQVCASLPSTFIVITSHYPTTIPLTQLTFIFLCNGTVYLTGTFAELEWVPGTQGSPSGSAPQLQTCGTYTPPNAAFNRMAFFDQAVPGALNLNNGDSLVVFDRTFLPSPGLTCLGTGGPGMGGSNCDDDFHGIPPWCVTVVNACTMTVTYQTPAASTTVADIPMSAMAGSDACPPECIQPSPP
jgi:hypothetical protein